MPSRSAALAKLTRADFEFDELLRELEFDLLKAVSKNRKDPLTAPCCPPRWSRSA